MLRDFRAIKQAIDECDTCRWWGCCVEHDEADHDALREHEEFQAKVVGWKTPSEEMTIALMDRGEFPF